MSRLNNVALDRVEQTRQAISHDPTTAWRKQVLEGEWVFGTGAPQFRAFITYEGGQTVFEMDNPTFLGGDGALPGPMHYCFSGLAACYTSIFALVAAERGIPLHRLRVRVEATVNFLRVFELGEAPVMEDIHIQLQVDSPASDAQLYELEELARQRCPVVWTLTNPVALRTSWSRLPAAV